MKRCKVRGIGLLEDNTFGSNWLLASDICGQGLVGLLAGRSKRATALTTTADNKVDHHCAANNQYATNNIQVTRKYP